MAIPGVHNERIIWDADLNKRINVKTWDLKIWENKNPKKKPTVRIWVSTTAPTYSKWGAASLTHADGSAGAIASRDKGAATGRQRRHDEKQAPEDGRKRRAVVAILIWL